VPHVPEIGDALLVIFLREGNVEHCDAVAAVVKREGILLFPGKCFSQCKQHI
jgi:hypothetical protein